jgi:hypothetical protein
MVPVFGRTATGFKQAVHIPATRIHTMGARQAAWRALSPVQIVRVGQSAEISKEGGK